MGGKGCIKQGDEKWGGLVYFGRRQELERELGERRRVRVALT